MDPADDVKLSEQNSSEESDVEVLEESGDASMYLTAVSDSSSILQPYELDDSYVEVVAENEQDEAEAKPEEKVESVGEAVGEAKSSSSSEFELIDVVTDEAASAEYGVPRLNQESPSEESSVEMLQDLMSSTVVEAATNEKELEAELRKQELEDKSANASEDEAKSNPSSELEPVDAVTDEAVSAKYDVPRLNQESPSVESSIEMLQNLMNSTVAEAVANKQEPEAEPSERELEVKLANASEGEAKSNRSGELEPVHAVDIETVVEAVTAGDQESETSKINTECAGAHRGTINTYKTIEAIESDDGEKNSNSSSEFEHIDAVTDEAASAEYGVPRLNQEPSSEESGVELLQDLVSSTITEAIPNENKPKTEPRERELEEKSMNASEGEAKSIPSSELEPVDVDIETAAEAITAADQESETSKFNTERAGAHRGTVNTCKTNEASEADDEECDPVMSEANADDGEKKSNSSSELERVNDEVATTKYDAPRLNLEPLSEESGVEVLQDLMSSAVAEAVTNEDEPEAQPSERKPEEKSASTSEGEAKSKPSSCELEPVDETAASTEAVTATDQESVKQSEQINERNVSAAKNINTEHAGAHRGTVKTSNTIEAIEADKEGASAGRQHEFYDASGKQFITKETPSLIKVKQLNVSARFLLTGMEIVLSNNGCLLMVDNEFIAQVEITQPNWLDEATSFEDAKTKLFRQLRVGRVLLDERAVEVNRCKMALLESVVKVLKQAAVDSDSRNTSVQLYQLADKCATWGRLSLSNFCHEIKENIVNEELRSKVAMAEKAEERLRQRMIVFRKFGIPQVDDSQQLYEHLRQLLTESAHRYRNILLETAPLGLKDLIKKVAPERIMLISRCDVKLFVDMRSVLNQEIFAGPLDDLEKRWVQQINSFQTDRMNHIPETTNGIFFYLCKSLEELILEISDKTDTAVKDLLKSTGFGWKPIEKITWQAQSLSTKCLERQYHFLFRLLKHFETGTNCNRKRFAYDVQLLNKVGKESSIWSGLKNMVDRTKRLLRHDEPRGNTLGIAEELYVWYCLLDDAVVHLLPKDYDPGVIESTLQSYLKLIREANQHHWESVRVTTHNTIQFIVQAVPYMSDAPSSSAIDRRILQKQLEISSLRDRSTTSNYRDLVNVFSSYWRFRSEVIVEIVSKMPIPVMNLLKEDLLNVVLIALEKDVESEKLLSFLRTYEEFLIDLNEVPFDWFIKTIANVDMEAAVSLNQVEVVNNKWCDTPNKTYRVIDPENFPAFCQSVHTEPPKHYVLDVLRKLVSFVTSQLQRNYWVSTDQCLSEEDQLTTTHKLLATIHHSLLYLREQADYVSFDLFFDESVKPFSSLIEHSSSAQDFSTRVLLLKESFWFIRKQNEVSVDTVLQLYSGLNPSIDRKHLKEPYERYREHFEEFMKLSVGKESSEAISAMVEKVKELISEDKHFTTWDAAFKEQTVPQILAGLASVWSVQVSKDVACTGKYLSPHCIQILCVLRLLSVDNPTKGIDKHLAQVLTGQGKSLILALLATLLALTGHRVRIGCYSEYLVERDRDAFREFYRKFEVASDVIYGSLSSMVNEFIRPEINGRGMELRTLVQNMILRGKTYQSGQIVEANFSTFLIDEADVFFTERYYGQNYLPAVVLELPCLRQIQPLIWETVNGGFRDHEIIKQRLFNMIETSSYSTKADFLTFYNKTHTYQLLSNDGTLKTYTNRSLFDEQLRLMIANAIEVCSSSAYWHKYKLNSFGQITYYYDEKYTTSTYLSYYNVFNYFRLKNSNFVPQVYGSPNYGYLTLDCGSLSYAMLPMNYPLIVGVSGTVTALNQYEKQTINQLYNIKKLSVMPSFFGTSNLRFDEMADFHHFQAKSSWRNHIFGQATRTLAVNRAVLVFFESDDELDAFKAAYGAQFDRLNELTENTADLLKERIVNEAGIARTITLATRGMGRGVDYKSSVMVEKNGGVHVIQSFFSMDSKEETQIKGRTARQDNHGSYELILCDEDLARCGLSSSNSHVSYAELVAKREQLFSRTNRAVTQNIEENKIKHHTTMNFLKSFFKA